MDSHTHANTNIQAQAPLKESNASRKKPKSTSLLALSSDFKDTSADYTKVQCPERDHHSHRSQTEKYRRKLPSAAERHRKLSVPDQLSVKREEEKEDVLKEQCMEVSATQKSKQVRQYFAEFNYMDCMVPCVPTFSTLCSPAVCDWQVPVVLQKKAY